MTAAVGQRKRHEIEMHVVKTFVGDREVAYWRHRVANHLGPLAMEALACPSGHVLAHGRPHHFGANSLTRALHAGMPEAVYDVEDGFAEVQWNERASRTVADINHETSIAYVDVLEIQTRPCVVSDALKVGVERLLGGEGIPVDAE